MCSCARLIFRSIGGEWGWYGVVFLSGVVCDCVV